MHFQCPKGHDVYTTWRLLRDFQECPTCNQTLYDPNSVKVEKKQRGKYRILALDQSSNITGYAIFDNDDLIKTGIFKTTHSKKEHDRFVEVRQWLLSMIATYQPDKIAFEDIQLQSQGGEVGYNTFKILAHLQGVLMETLAESNIEYEIISPSTWRNACGVTGKGRSDRKRSMQFRIKEWYGAEVTDDVADAIGIGRTAAGKRVKETKIVSWE